MAFVRPYNARWTMAARWQFVHDALNDAAAFGVEQIDQGQCGNHAVFACIGARGHFNPMLQLARQLASRPGWKVTWAVGSFGPSWLKEEPAMDMISGGLDSIATLSTDLKARIAPHRSDNFDAWWMGYAVTHVSVPILYKSIAAMRCKPTVMVVDSSTFGGLIVAHMLKIPLVVNSPFLLCGAGVPTGVEFCKWSHLIRSSSATSEAFSGLVASVSRQPTHWFNTWLMSTRIRSHIEAALARLLEGTSSTVPPGLLLEAAAELSLRPLASAWPGTLWSAWRLYTASRLFLQNSAPGIDAVRDALPRQIRFIGSTDYVSTQDTEVNDSIASYAAHIRISDATLYEFFQGLLSATTGGDLTPLKNACVLVSMGTLIHPNARVLDRIVQALNDARCVVWPMAPPMRSLLSASPPASFLFPSFIDLPRLLRSGMVSLFLSHCGMGSAQQSLLASVPLLCLPHATDQPDVAHRIASLGAGIVFDPYDDSSWGVSDLRSACSELRTVPRYKEAASLLGSALTAAGGAVRGSALIVEAISGSPEPIGSNGESHAAFMARMDSGNLSMWPLKALLVLIVLGAALIAFVRYFCHASKLRKPKAT